MDTLIRAMTEKDTDEVYEMMKVFYSSPAVSTDGSDKIFTADIENCIGPCPYLEGYIFQEGSLIQGYAMLAKSFSTEFGGPCIWIEDLYLKPEYRGNSIGSKFFAFIEKKYPDAFFRLELEKDNKSALKLYTKCGYEVLPYTEMIKLKHINQD